MSKFGPFNPSKAGKGAYPYCGAVYDAHGNPCGTMTIKFTKPAKEIRKAIKNFEAHFAKGDRVFSIRQAHQGDGYGQFYIYAEDNANGVSDVSGIEYVTGAFDFVRSHC